jgi:uncharacterized RDD family membrane protein YckC
MGATLLESRSSVDTHVVGRRVGQYLVDAVAVGAVTIGLFFLASLVAPAGDANRAGDPSDIVWYAVFGLSLVFGAWYWVFRPAGHHGQTFGMQLFGIRVVDVDGGPARKRQLLGRWLMLFFDGLFAGLLGLLIMAVTPKRQRLGDLAAHTLVVRV